MYSVYILHSPVLDKYYIGYTHHVSGRLSYHNSSSNTIWTRRGRPWSLVFSIDDLSEAQAIGIEKHIKRMKSRTYIANLIKYAEMREKLKERYG